LEREVITLDPFSSQSAHALSQEEYFEEEEHVDGGAWEGGTYTLGGDSHEGVTRRDILADAATRRINREKKHES
jgi:hypothetical protein